MQQIEDRLLELLEAKDEKIEKLEHEIYTMRLPQSVHIQGFNIDEICDIIKFALSKGWKKEDKR